MEYAPLPTRSQLVELGRQMGCDLRHEWRIEGGLGCTMDVLRSGSADGPLVVLRRHGPWWPDKGVDVAMREFIVLDRLRTTAVPVPQPLWLGRGQVFAEPAMVIAYVEGSAEMAPDDALDWASQLADALADIHATPLDASVRAQLASGPPESADREPPEGFFEHPLAGPLLGRVQQLRTQNAAHELTLIHADFWPGNVLWRSGRLVAIVDWEDAALGEPTADIAYCALDMRYLDLDEASHHLVARYRLITGRSLDTLEYWTASALLRPMPDIAQRIPAWEQLGHAAVNRKRLRQRHTALIEEVLAT